MTKAIGGSYYLDPETFEGLEYNSFENKTSAEIKSFCEKMVEIYNISKIKTVMYKGQIVEVNGVKETYRWGAQRQHLYDEYVVHIVIRDEDKAASIMIVADFGAINNNGEKTYDSDDVSIFTTPDRDATFSFYELGGNVDDFEDNLGCPASVDVDNKIQQIGEDDEPVFFMVNRYASNYAVVMTHGIVNVQVDDDTGLYPGSYATFCADEDLILVPSDDAKRTWYVSKVDRTDNIVTLVY